ncbi:quercetin dioxygenase-like cupin family protein [Neorhizobium galegae]|uniref:cupin domain-containing protein n=1 Tax=Neorhizobium galegae TaxID=399 RepID=UPI00278A7DE1|nr:cupin domain-containing protein [Neorhizobium galegae]MDQ0137532.1 quercetin dioxygenase-like cupin family protein [Neorhizobium galegae]
MKKSIKAYNWDDIPERELKPGIIQRGFRGDGVMVTYNYLQPGCKGSPHSHPFDQIFMVIQGRVTLHVEEQTFDCKPGTVIRIPPHHTHYVDPPSPEDGVAINVDIFGLAREDYLNIVAYQDDDFSK